jgi:hypothetical protein
MRVGYEVVGEYADSLSAAVKLPLAASRNFTACQRGFAPTCGPSAVARPLGLRLPKACQLSYMSFGRISLRAAPISISARLLAEIRFRRNVGHHAIVLTLARTDSLGVVRCGGVGRRIVRGQLRIRLIAYAPARDSSL